MWCLGFAQLYWVLCSSYVPFWTYQLLDGVIIRRKFRNFLFQRIEAGLSQDFENFGHFLETYNNEHCWSHFNVNLTKVSNNHKHENSATADQILVISHIKYWWFLITNISEFILQMQIFFSPLQDSVQRLGCPQAWRGLDPDHRDTPGSTSISQF